MTRNQKIREKRLVEIEGELRSLLQSCLQECAQGRWGLFGQNAQVDHYERYSGWPEANRLRELAEEIRAAVAETGPTNDNCERFLKLCSLRGSNVPGEPKLAADFLADLIDV